MDTVQVKDATLTYIEANYGRSSAAWHSAADNRRDLADGKLFPRGSEYRKLMAQRIRARRAYWT